MVRKPIVEPSRGDRDWFAVRECFVRAFHHYPLYKYMIPNAKKRPEFLRQYLEAIYEVTVRNGNAILLCIKVNGKSDEAVVIGGVLFVPPSKTNGGWQCDRDEDFWDAYKKYNLKKIDQEAFTRLQRYEEWEYEHISKKVCAANMPMWNAIFCGIDPEYAGKGYGSISYVDCLTLISSTVIVKSTSRKSLKEVKSKLQNVFRKLNEFISIMLPSHIDNKVTVSQTSTTSRPPVFVLSHSRSAVKFHQKNGSHLITSIPYELNDSSDISFEVSVLLVTRSAPPRRNKPGGISNIKEAILTDCL